MHYDLNKKMPLEKIHFDSWLSLFNQVVDELHEGKIATMAKTRAQSIAAVMQFKMEQAHQKNQ